jgi:DNA-binding MarR family transcriptional regulator
MKARPAPKPAAPAGKATVASKPAALAAQTTEKKMPPARGPAAPVGKTGKKALATWEPAVPGLWFYNWKIWLEARQRLDRALAPLELRAREFWLLAIAGAGNIPQHEIADAFGLDPSSVVAVVDALERRGWLRRVRNPDDRRMQWVQRTEAGDRLFARALPRAQCAEAGQLAVLSAAQQRHLVTAMRKLARISK